MFDPIVNVLLCIFTIRFFFLPEIILLQSKNDKRAFYSHFLVCVLKKLLFFFFLVLISFITRKKPEINENISRLRVINDFVVVQLKEIVET